MPITEVTRAHLKIAARWKMNPRRSKKKGRGGEAEALKNKKDKRNNLHHFNKLLKSLFSFHLGL